MSSRTETIIVDCEKNYSHKEGSPIIEKSCPCPNGEITTVSWNPCRNEREPQCPDCGGGGTGCCGPIPPGCRCFEPLGSISADNQNLTLTPQRELFLTQ